MNKKMGHFGPPILWAGSRFQRGHGAGSGNVFFSFFFFSFLFTPSTFFFFFKFSGYLVMNKILDSREEHTEEGESEK